VLSEAKIEEIVTTYSSCLYRFALAYLKDHATSQDIVQEVFIKLLDKQPSFGSPEQEKAWLYKVTANMCKNLLKSGRYKREIPLTEEHNDITASAKDDMDIADHLMKLDEKYRAPIHLYYYEGYSIKEIAKIMNQNPSTISTHLDRARQQLKEMMSEAT